MEEKDFKVECGVCRQWLYNHVGSTPCCGSIAYLVNDDDTVLKEVLLFSNKGIAKLDFSEDE
jgi:hypothetical protein